MNTPSPPESLELLPCPIKNCDGKLELNEYDDRECPECGYCVEDAWDHLIDDCPLCQSYCYIINQENVVCSGCGLELTADGEQEVVDQWNKLAALRTPATKADSSLADELEQLIGRWRTRGPGNDVSSMIEACNFIDGNADKLLAALRTPATPRDAGDVEKVVAQVKAELDALVRTAHASPYHTDGSRHTAEVMRDQAVVIVRAALATLSPSNRELVDAPIGQAVAKRGGDYEFDGEIRAVIVKRSGQIRYAVEDDRGLLLIMNAKQCGLEP